MSMLKQSTAVDVLIGPFVDLTDGSTAEEAESPSVLLSKNGQALAAKNDATTPTHDDAGYYNCELDATDTNTFGTLALIVEASANALPVRHEFQVVPANVYDSIVSGSDYLETDAVAVSGDATAADNMELQYDGTGITGDSYPATQAQVGNIASGTAAINTTASSFTKAGAEPETNTYTSTHQLDGTYHEVEDDATATDAYYEFDIGSDGVPVSVTWAGYAQSNGDSYTIHAYNYVGTTYEQIGSISASNGTTLQTNTYDLTTAHVGTGANVGKVRFRFLSADGTKFATDRILCSYAQATAGIANGSTVTLSASATDTNLIGNNWNLALGGQDISGAYISGAVVTGVSSGTSGVTFEDCHFGAVTVPPGTYVRCGIGDSDGTFTAASDGEYVFIDCFSIVAGSGTPDFAFTGLGASTGINVRGWKGGASYTLDSDCTLSHEVVAGGGTTVVTGGADVEIRGTCRAVTITATAAETVQFVGVTGPITLGDDGASTATINLYGVAASVTDNTNGATVTDKTVSNEDVEAVLADTNELQTDLTNGGRLDLIFDAIVDDTDLIDDGTSGLAKIATDVAAVLADTGTTIPATITTMQGNVTDILADTNELQADWANGGRLDLIVDAILDDTDLIDDGTSGLAKIATDVAAVLVDTGTTLDTLVDRIAVIVMGTVTNAGTGTETFTYGGVTATVTVDEDGNRTIAWS